MTKRIPPNKIFYVRHMLSAKDEKPEISTFTNVVRFDTKGFVVKCAIQHNELMETLKTFQLN